MTWGRGSGLNLVVTHRDRASAENLFHALGVQVDDLVCAPDGFARKPDPQMNLVLMERHGLDPSEVIAVGDRPIDIDAARAAGIEGLLLSDTPRANTITKLTELLNWL
ncbi:MAG: HAD-IA family hydrolase [Cutibacterium avidum]|nr:HAD-IA family hydrolase [Cutibacterium avidum]